MLLFNAQSFVKATMELERLQGVAINLHDEPAKFRQVVLSSLSDLKSEFDPEAFDGIVAQISRLEDRVLLEPFSGPEDPHIIVICELLRELANAVAHELKSHVFLRISRERKQWYSEEDTDLFGPEVSARFPKARYHIAEAGRCFALERWDACVHHLMLTTEQGLRKWARSLGVQTKGPLELANWEEILVKAEDKLKSFKTSGVRKTIQSDKQKKYLSETLAFFSFIQNAWRNHSAHGRETYDDRKARNLMTYVEAFMRHLAGKRLKKKAALSATPPPSFYDVLDRLQMPSPKNRMLGGSGQKLGE